MDERYLNARKTTLHVVLVMSMIGSGAAFFSHFLMGIMLPTMKTLYYSGAVPYPSEVSVMMEELFETPRPYFLCCALLYAMSFAGVVIMWKLRKSGFHLYTLAQLLALLVTLLFLGNERLSLGDVMLTLLFITYYYFSLRTLGAITPHDGETESPDYPEDSENPESPEIPEKPEDQEK